MKTTQKRLISMLLALTLLIVCVPLQTQANAANGDYVSLEKAGAQLRDYMVARNTGELTIKVHLVDDRELVDHQVLDILQAEAMKHTGNGKEGDVLRWAWSSIGYDMTDDFDGKNHYITFSINSSIYYSTAANEKTLDAKVAEILASLELDGKSDYEKICAIYNYICQNVKYSDNYLAGKYDQNSADWREVHSTYGALVENEAVCQGFAGAVYRLMLEAGIDCRYISGDGHGWNIVKLDGLYYCVDATWDSDAWRVSGELKWFLKGASDFWDDGHTSAAYCATEEFMDTHPISPLDYGAAATATASGTWGSNISWELTEDGTLTIRGSGDMNDCSKTYQPWQAYRGYIKKVVIESGITCIGTAAFYDCQELTSVTIPSTVEMIGNYAFGLCAKLEKIVIPDSVTTMGTNVFECCWSLQNVTLSKNLKAIGNRTFLYCMQLKTVAIPSGVQSIEEEAFSGCTGLTKLTIPNTVTKIGSGAFSSAFDPDAEASIVIPESVTEVGQNCFAWSGVHEVIWNAKTEKLDTGMFYLCFDLEKVTLSESITVFGDEVFKKCTNLSGLALPSSLTEMGKNTFEDCYSLTQIALPAGLTAIPGSTFLRCRSLTEIDIPDQVTYIGGSAFEKCTSLTKVTIPAGIQEIGRFAFGYCTGLETVIFEGDAPATVGDVPFSTVVEVDWMLCYPQGNATWTEEIKAALSAGNPYIQFTGYEMRDGHMILYRWEADANSHWYGCLDCDRKENVTAHTFDNNCDMECNDCGYQRAITHVYQQKFNEGFHWWECTCGDLIDEQVHVYDNWCDESCDECGYIRTVEHQYYIARNDETHHWWECNCGAKDGYTAHYGTGTTCDGCGHAIDHTHSFGEMFYNNDQHWSYCSTCGHMEMANHTWSGNVCSDCGMTKPSEDSDQSSGTACSHTYDNNCDEYCNQCGYQRPVSHQYTLKKYNEGFHWMECTCGAIAEEQTHIFDDWCDESCSKCDYTRTVEHQYYIVRNDETHHWWECDCGATSQREAHYGTGEVCDGCAYLYNHTHTKDNTYCDDTHHWFGCACGSYTTEKEAHTWSGNTCSACGMPKPDGQETTPTTQPTEPSTQPTEPSTQPTEPATKPTEPATEPTGPATQPTQPSTQPTGPATTPAEPDEPTEPSSDATEPSSDATEPSADVTVPSEAPTQPSETTPAPTEPGATEPGATEPGATEPEHTEPAATDSAPGETNPGASTPTGTTPADPIPTEPDDDPQSPSPAIWIVLVGIAGAGAAAAFLFIKKPKNKPE